MTPAPILAKRTKGAPLSEAELKQRREAAQGRRGATALVAVAAGAAGAAGGSVAAARTVPALVVARKEQVFSRYDFRPGAARLTDRWREGQHRAIDAAVERRRKANSAPLNHAAEAEPKGRPISYLTRTLRGERKAERRASSRVAEITADEDRAWLHESPPRFSGEEADVARADLDFHQRKMAELKAVTPHRKGKARAAHTAVRRKAAWDVSGRKTSLSDVPGGIDARMMDLTAQRAAADGQAPRRTKALEEWSRIIGEDEGRLRGAEEAYTKAERKLKRLPEGTPEHAAASKALDDAMNAASEAARALEQSQQRARRSVSRMQVRTSSRGRAFAAQGAEIQRRQSKRPKISASISKERERELREALKPEAARVARAAKARATRRAPAQAGRLASDLRARAVAMLNRKLPTKLLTGRAKIAAGVVGGVAGAAAGWGLGRAFTIDEKLARLMARRSGQPEPGLGKLAKAAPSDPPEKRLTRDVGRLLRGWAEKPGTIGDPRQIEMALGATKDAFASGAEQVTAAPGALTGAGGQGMRIEVGFDARHPVVQRELAENDLRLIRQIGDDSREAIRQALQDGVMRGFPVEHQARQIREAAGLGPVEGFWVRSFRAQLEAGDARALTRALRDRRFDRTVAKYVESGEPPPAELVDTWVDAYKRRAIAYRATKIARTEGLKSANLGSVAQARAFLEDHPELTVEKTWLATRDGRERHSHHELHGKTVVGIDTPFIATDEQERQSEIRYPHDPNAPARETVACRCVCQFKLIRRPEWGGFIAEAVAPPAGDDA